jgi:putative transposase
VHRPRVRSYDGHEVVLPTWTAAQAEDWLGRWAMNLMLINVSTRKLRRAVRLPEGDLPVIVGDGTSKSAASRRFVALSAERLAEWMASDLSKLDLLVIQIDGLHIGNDLVLVAALGIDGEGHKHPLALIEGATENAAVVQALIDNLIERGLDPRVFQRSVAGVAVASILHRWGLFDLIVGACDDYGTYRCCWQSSPAGRVAQSAGRLGGRAA